MKWLIACLAATTVFTVHFTHTPPPPGAIINPASDLTCVGVFLSPKIATANYTTHYPMTVRTYLGARQFLLYSGNGHVISFREPVMSSCDTPLASVATATQEYDYGPFVVAAGGGGLAGSPGFVPNANATYMQWIGYDPVRRTLLGAWYPSYGAVVHTNSLAAATLNDPAHTLTTTGCWGFLKYPSLWVGTGLLQIPPEFVTAHLSPGQRWAVGYGGGLGYAVGNSNGPFLLALAPPADNSCTTFTDYEGDPTSAGVIMEAHPANAAGPNCDAVAGLNPGCKPPTAPTHPYPKRQAFALYSNSVYSQAWDPWAGHGWDTFNTFFSSVWYDDGVKQGVVRQISTPSGWIDTTVLAAPAPTYNPRTNIGTLTAASVNMHDGYSINPGDVIWIQTCIPGTTGGPGCITANGQNRTIGTVLTVNPATGALTYSGAGNVDSGNGDHVPVVPGFVLGGGVYSHGAPTTSRNTWRLQVDDPAQYAAVLTGKRPSDMVEAVYDIDFSAQLWHTGAPSRGAGHVPGTNRPAGVMADTTAKQILMTVSNAVTGPRNLIYVFSVKQGASAPPPAPPSPPLPAAVRPAPTRAR